jgi:hypothetical protein
MTTAGKPPKVILVAVARKLLVYARTAVRVRRRSILDQPTHHPLDRQHSISGGSGEARWPPTSVGRCHAPIAPAVRAHAHAAGVCRWARRPCCEPVATVAGKSCSAALAVRRAPSPMDHPEAGGPVQQPWLRLQGLPAAQPDRVSGRKSRASPARRHRSKRIRCPPTHQAHFPHSAPAVAPDRCPRSCGHSGFRVRRGYG